MMLEKHRKRTSLIVGLLVFWFAVTAMASAAGVNLDEARVATVFGSHQIQVELSLRNRLSVDVNQIEIELSCEVSDVARGWVSSGRRAVSLDAGAVVSVSISLAGPGSTPKACHVKLLGYTVERPSGGIIKMLLGTGFSADERAALLGAMAAGDHQKVMGVWAAEPVPQEPSVQNVLRRLLSWSVLATQDARQLAPITQLAGLERFDQSLQLVLAARERGTKDSSPIAFLVPDNVSTMADALKFFAAGQVARIKLLPEFAALPESVPATPPKADDAGFYQKLSLALLVGIFAWIVWRWRARRREGVNENV